MNDRMTQLEINRPLSWLFHSYFIDYVFRYQGIGIRIGLNIRHTLNECQQMTSDCDVLIYS